MSWLEWWTAERVVALATMGQLVVLVAAALYARAQVQQVRAQVQEARDLREAEAQRREAEARPYVVMDFEPEVPPLLYLVVTNLGRTMASNVRFEVDPPFRSSQDEQWWLPVAQIKLLTFGIPSLAPGKRHVTAFDTLFRREELGLPSTYHVRISYEGEDGQRFEDVQRLDLDLYRDLRPVQQDTIHQVSQTLKRIQRQFEKWSAGPEGGLLMLSPRDQRRRNEEALAEFKARRSPENQAAGPGKVGLLGRLLQAAGRLRRRG